MKEKRPNLVFIMETKLRQYKLELIKYKIEFFGLFVVDVWVRIEVWPCYGVMVLMCAFRIIAEDISMLL